MIRVLGLNFAGTRKRRRTPAPEELLTQRKLLSDWAVQAGLLDRGIEVAEDDLEAAIRRSWGRSIRGAGRVGRRGIWRGRTRRRASWSHCARSGPVSASNPALGLTTGTVWSSCSRPAKPNPGSFTAV